MNDSDSAMFDHMYGATQSVDTDTVIGIQKMREEIKTSSQERDAYKKALEDITKAVTVKDMLNIAYSVLAENRK